MIDLQIGQKWKFTDGLDEEIYELVSVDGPFPRGKCIYSKTNPSYVGIEGNLTLGDIMSKDVSKWSSVNDSIDREFGYINYPNGVHCTQCNDFNQYVTQGNQTDGTYKCYSCRK